jgi:hypothetical protein
MLIPETGGLTSQICRFGSRWRHLHVWTGVSSQSEKLKITADR